MGGTPLLGQADSLSVNHRRAVVHLDGHRSFASPVVPAALTDRLQTSATAPRPLSAVALDQLLESWIGAESSKGGTGIKGGKIAKPKLQR